MSFVIQRLHYTITGARVSYSMQHGEPMHGLAID